jgi:multiple sugar transport system ATP-binding protein
LPTRRELTFGVRPEKLSRHPAGEGRLPAQVAVVERLGAETVIGCRLMTGEENKDQRLLEHDLVFVRVSGNPKIKIGELCSLDYQADDVLWFDIDNGDRIFLDQE